MLALELLAEQKIADAVERGELAGLPGEGAPLVLDDDALVPEDLRAAYRLLKNAGYIPPEVDALREISELERFVQTAAGDDASRARAVRKLSLLKTRIESSYYDKALERLAR